MKRYDSTSTNKIHIGSIIEQQVRAKARNVTWLAARLNCERTNIYSIFRRKSVDCSLLYRLCEILDFDFFATYSASLAAHISHSPRYTDIQSSDSAEENR
ncbi:MAG: hypothetical protein K2M97_05570 [Muribaculaceae bacterium]|nr:hypothetical protein [Muribaculaceae bacterium]